MKNKKFEIDIFMFILINLFVLVLINDYITCFLNLNYLVSIIISFFITLILNFFLKGKIHIKKNIDKEDLIFYILLSFIMIITIPFADRAFDSYNYHLYLQENPFGNKLGFDLFAGKNFNTFTYAFSDRLFYLFRYFLGFRLGLILNYFILIVIYYQVKKIFQNIIGFKINKYALVIFSMLSVLTLSVIDIVDSYYIDLLSVVILLEAFNFSMFSDKLFKGDKLNYFNFGYLALLFGFGFVVKISNAIPIIFIFLIYIFNHRNVFKCLNFKNIIIILMTFILPFVLYLVYTFIQTGNPVFPFYNSIFKSKYFSYNNWMDTRFGPSRLVEVIVWPIMILFYPGRCVDTSIVEPFWAYGYVISIIYLVYYIIKKSTCKEYKFNTKKVCFITFVFLFYLVWSKFLLGYSRYGLVVLILGNIITFMFLYDIVSKKKTLLLGLLIPFILLNYAYSGSNFMYKNQDWIFNNYFNTEGSYFYNIRNIFSRDVENVDFDKNSVWAVVYNNSGLLQEINSDIPMINLSELSNLNKNSSSQYKNLYTINLIKKRLSSYDNIYTAVDSTDYLNFIDSLNNFGFEIEDVTKTLTDKLLPRKFSYVYVFKIKNVSKAFNNLESFNDKKSVDLKSCSNNKITLFISTCYNLNNVFYEDYKVSLYKKNGDEEKFISDININHNGDVEKYEFNIDSSEYNNLIFKVKNSNDENDPNLWVSLVNFRSVCE